MTSPAAPDALKHELRTRMGPALRSAGFKGSAPTWSLTSEAGDRAIVNVQSSASSSSREVLFTINTAVIPITWWRWTNHQLGMSESRAPKEYDGLWRERVNARRQQATNRPDWWSITDLASADRAVSDAIEQLQTTVIAALEGLLQPGAMLEAARAGRLGGHGRDPRGAVAVLLTGYGQSEELVSLIAELETLEDARLRAIFWPTAEWCRAQIA